MDTQSSARLAYEDSCRLLQSLGYLEEGAIPPIPDHRPRYDDEEPLGVAFFRTLVAQGDLQNLTLPRTYFGRSEVGPVSFRNTDLSESNLCWNDFNEVDFSDCDLSGGDLRASLFRKVKFVRANLRNADFRRSGFEDCDFTNAEMLGAKITGSQGAELRLSDKQRSEIEWQSTEGEAPDGG